MAPKIKLRIAIHCGQTRWYPACPYTQATIECMERRSFSKKQLAVFQKLGFDIEYTKGESQ